MKCVLIGNYGVDNLGDEALRDYFLDAFPEVTWTVLSASPKAQHELPRLPFGLHSLRQGGWRKTITAYRGCDAVVFGGGSLFTDVESVKACFLWAWHAGLAFFLRKPVFLAFQGMGPYKTKVGERLARFVARHARYISVRDTASYERVASWGLSTEIIQTFDPVFSVMEKQKVVHGTKNVCTLIPRANSSDAFMQSAISLLRMRPYIHHLQILLMQPDDAGEQAIANRLQRELGLPATIIPARTLRELLKGVGTSAIVLSQRFHGALAALASGIEIDIVPQGKGDKMYELQQLINSGKANVPQLCSMVEHGRLSLSSALRLIESDVHS